MRIATATLKSISAYSQSGPPKSSFKDGEKHDAYDERCWREKAHADSSGHVIIPPMAFKQSLETAAKRRADKIKGKGQATYTKCFVGGVLVIDPLVLPITIADLDSVRIYANADGVRGSGKRVWRRFPLIQSWSGDVAFHVIDDVLEESVFERTLVDAGRLVGIGRFRPEKGGYNGRFSVEAVRWEDAA